MYDNKNVIEIKEVSLTIKKKKLLDKVSLEVERGTIVGITGKNGSGKTVLLKVLTGFAKADEGTVLVKGKEIGKVIDYPDDCGIIIESPGFIGYKSGYANLVFLASLKKRINSEKIRRTMEMLGLDPEDKKTVSKYSLGMKQRLGIAQAIMEDQDLLILDEPFNSLDKEGVKLVYRILSDARNDGKTIVLVSHYREDIEALCDRVYEIKDGTLLQQY